MKSIIFPIALVGALSASALTIEVGPARTFRTLDDGLCRVQNFRRANTNEAIEIRLDAGDYPVPEGVWIGRDRARSEWGALTIRAADRAKCPRLLGGTPVTGWKREGFRGRADVWSAPLPPARRTAKGRVQLFYLNGRRMEPARYPNLNAADPYRTGFAFAKNDGKSMWTPPRFADTGYWYDELLVRPEDDRRWAHPEEGWVIVFPRHNWWNRSYGIAGYTNGVLKLETKHEMIKDRLFPWDRWCIQGVAEELDAPGEWYHERTTGKIHFIPPVGVDPNRATATVASAPHVVNVMKGTGNVRLYDLEIVGGFSGIDILGNDTEVRGCRIHDLGFIGGTGVHVAAERVRVADNDVWRTGGHGISVSDLPNRARTDSRLDVTVANNYVHHTGDINSHGIGISIYGQGIVVTHNYVHDTPRCALFGFGRFCDISYNRVRHTNTINDDSAAIYGGGWQEGVGTVIRYNHITDSIGFKREADGSYRLFGGATGIAPDEACGGVAIYGNFIAGCHREGVGFHCGRHSVVSNNVFVSNASFPISKWGFQFSNSGWTDATNGYFVAHRMKDIQLSVKFLYDADPRWLDFPALAQKPDLAHAFDEFGCVSRGVRMTRNIFYYPDQGETAYVRTRNMTPANNPFDYDLVWPGAGKAPRVAAEHHRFPRIETWKDWQAAGQERHGVVADPRFRDPAKGDYRLQADSPAFKLGFIELPYDRMGLEKTAFRPELPVEAEGLREHPEWIR